MSRLLDQPVSTFRIGFKDTPQFDETRYARLAAGRFKTNHTEYIVDPAALGLIEKLVWHHDGPFADSSAVPTFIVSQLTRQKVTVVLTGDGGDELFGGYDRFAAALWAERLQGSMQSLLRNLSGSLSNGPTSRHWRSRVKRFTEAAGLPLESRITSWAGLFYNDLEKMLAPELLKASEPIDRLRYLRRFEDQLPRLSPLRRLLLLNFNTYLPDDLLVKTDRCSMANSLEARCPFLDTALTEFVASLADSMKVHRGQTKIVLREAFADLIPREILQRKKMGFGVPLGLWFRGSLREMLFDSLRSPRARYRDYLSAKFVNELITIHDSGREDLGQPLWALLTFETWLRSLPNWKNTMPIAAATAPV
jgi:asparagine synthase (glutamine-hydrolysing)